MSVLIQPCVLFSISAIICPAAAAGACAELSDSRKTLGLDPGRVKEVRGCNPIFQHSQKQTLRTH